MSLLETRPREKTSERPAGSINLLPQEIASEQRVKKQFGYAVLGVGAPILILIVVSVMQRMQISNQQNTLRETQAQVTSLQGQVGALAPFDQLNQSVDAKRQTLAAALLGDVSWTRFLDDLDHRIPGDSWLTSLALNATSGTSPDGQPSYGTVQYNGTVKSFPGLAGWLDTMAEAKGLEFVYLGNASKSGQSGGLVTFTASANLTAAALSGRCQTEAAPCP